MVCGYGDAMKRNVNWLFFQHRSSILDRVKEKVGMHSTNRMKSSKCKILVILKLTPNINEVNGVRFSPLSMQAETHTASLESNLPEACCMVHEIHMVICIV